MEAWLNMSLNKLDISSETISAANLLTTAQHPVSATTLHLSANKTAWASECPDVKNYTWLLNLVWHRMLYSSCIHMATVGVKGLKQLCVGKQKW